jgi:Family of unknown function (DUF5519)
VAAMWRCLTRSHIARLNQVRRLRPERKGNRGLNSDKHTENLPVRRGPVPHTTATNPHEQLTQNAPVELQEELYGRARGLPGVTEGPSRISVPGARAFLLQDGTGGPPEALIMGGEFAHLHPAHDGSLHLTLPPGFGEEVFQKGWGESHPLAGKWGVPTTVAMIYGPRDEQELEIVWRIVQASYEFARGTEREEI